MAHSQHSRQGGEQQNQSSGGDEFDSGYHEWRSEQMRTLDNDYRAWRLESNNTFSDEFTTWRDERGRKNARNGHEDEGERAPHDQGNAITSPEQNQNVAERADEEERDK